MLTIAIYPRKSLFTGKGESIQSQIDLCKAYCETHFDNPTFLIYDEDEGYSGGNTRRPAFRRMMADAAARKFDVLCCYRIDRISRNVSDFSQTLETLQQNRITFVSLREQFDTSTPMGRAMMYIASVFAQLERDTIAERVRDNAHFLAQQGYWLGGNTPTGYTSARQTVTRDGKERTFYILVDKPDEQALVQELYDRFLSLGSLSGLLTYCMQHNLKSKLGTDFSATTLRVILSNPVYCIADDAAYQFFSTNPFDLRADAAQFDGLHGVTGFNRTDKKPGSYTTINDTSEWIISVGHHLGLIPGEKWVAAQMLLQPKGDSRNKPRTHSALLSGLLICGQCGSYMRPKAYGKPLEDGSRKFSYICECKDQSRGVRCTMTNAPGRDLDAAVVKHLISLPSTVNEHTRDTVRASAAASQRLSDDQERIRQLTAENDQTEKRISNLFDSLSLEPSPELRSRILQQMNALEAAIRDNRERILALQASAASHSAEVDVYAYMRTVLSDFANTFDSLSHDERAARLRNILEKVVWDGENIDIHIFGEKRLPK